jgi:hypothetical protein
MHPARIARTREAYLVQADGSLRKEEPERYGLAGLKERFSNPFMFQYYPGFYFFNRMENRAVSKLKFCKVPNFQQWRRFP